MQKLPLHQSLASEIPNSLLPNEQDRAETTPINVSASGQPKSTAEEPRSQSSTKKRSYTTSTPAQATEVTIEDDDDQDTAAGAPKNARFAAKQKGKRKEDEDLAFVGDGRTHTPILVPVETHAP